VSVKRIYNVAKARKAQRPCSKCGTAINPGDGYLYWEPFFRSNFKQVRCLKRECYPRPSERESSLMSSVLAAQEAVEDALEDTSGAEDASFFNDLAADVVSALEEVIDQYREADENFGGGGSSASGERADELEDAKSEIESFYAEDAPERGDLDACDKADPQNPWNPEHGDGNKEGCEECDAIWAEALDTWREEQASNLQDALSNIG